jgi:hypothetical protein
VGRLDAAVDGRCDVYIGIGTVVVILLVLLLIGLLR